ncbi:MAG: HD domain-containing protein, partial [Proteobacteria bacterium]|nr:HD domain-containing protein [Pseudomonadota bacterium]
EETSLRALNSGARDFLVKPFNNQEALVRIHNLLEMRLAHKQLSQYSETLELEVRARTKEIESTQLEIVHRLGLAAEYRDNETGAHIVRMSHYSMEIGKMMGLNDKETDLILHSAPMHDIGKIGIPDNILLKPAKLTFEEFDIMKQHAVIGTGILSGAGSELLQAAGNIALTHHEKWDGTGYPNGLKGLDIPLHGRITACADVFDALTSKRPYKTPWTIDKAVDFVSEMSGKHFDPAVVDAMMRSLPAMLKIKEANDN